MKFKKGKGIIQKKRDLQKDIEETTGESWGETKKEHEMEIKIKRDEEKNGEREM